MRVTREFIEKMAVAILDHPSDEFVIEQHSDGKLHFGAIETIERVKAISLTKVTVPKVRDREPSA